MGRLTITLFTILILSSCQEQKPFVQGDSERGYTVELDDYFKYSDNSGDTTLMKLEAVERYKKRHQQTPVPFKHIH